MQFLLFQVNSLQWQNGYDSNSKLTSYAEKAKSFKLVRILKILVPSHMY